MIKSSKYLSTDNAVATVELVSIHMHATALAFHISIAFAHQFADNASNGLTACNNESVATVGSDNRVAWDKSSFNTNSNGFL